MKVAVRAWSALHDFAIGAVGITVAAALVVMAVPPILAGLAGAAATAAIHAVWASPRARADSKDLAKLRGEVDYLGSPGHDVEVAKRAQQMRRYGPRFPGDHD